MKSGEGSTIHPYVDRKSRTAFRGLIQFGHLFAHEEDEEVLEVDGGGQLQALAQRAAFPGGT